jgi:hypothetical protein
MDSPLWSLSLGMVTLVWPMSQMSPGQKRRVVFQFDENSLVDAETLIQQGRGQLHGNLFIPYMDRREEHQVQHLKDEITRLRQENERLRRGQFTEEELKVLNGERDQSSNDDCRLEGQ